MTFGNVLTAMVTPFDDQNELDLERTEILVEHLLKNGTDGLVVGGTTGESPTLTNAEKLTLYKRVVEIADGRIPVIAGTGSNNTFASIEFTKQVERLGVDGVLTVAPYYNKPNQEGIYQHFKAIAESTTLPIMLYNIPGRSVINVEPETTIALSKIPNIVAVKESSQDLFMMTKIIDQTDDDFMLYSGDDGFTLPVLSVGGKGIVSVSSHLLGNEMQEMVKAYFQGDVGKAAAMHRYLLPKMEAFFKAPSPSPVKTALNKAGILVGSVRLPLVPLSAEEEKQLYQDVGL
ncbi:4-hydroxy-tetrahydrodipicolinate synthase [Tenuibacillus multivorans]|uniref:4-hydroxy-tetrahydrodipicolinate synthase n=2 Tax=Tenuibacillus multivorans TaxID=237069 RepID=A0A1G9XUJ4_9BACI|nr:4-hydroxy-tetrahydrodipicolinate synthase [Tenuibacillus multivorans]SDN00444.1 4-hydroxy-tetrahydrodipicolinate synthase [Tenuibacillus multivorans]